MWEGDSLSTDPIFCVYAEYLHQLFPFLSSKKSTHHSFQKHWDVDFVLVQVSMFYEVGWHSNDLKSGDFKEAVPWCPLTFVVEEVFQ